MDLKYFCDCKMSLAIGALAFLFCVSCSSSKEAQAPQVPVEDLPQILRASGPQTDTTRNESEEEVTLSYKNKSTSVTIPIDPNKQDFILELKGLERADNTDETEQAEAAEDEQERDDREQAEDTRRSRPDSTVMEDSLVQANMAKKIRQVLKDFRKAQDLFYRQDYKGALDMVNRSLETQPTSDALGLKGTIFFMQDDISSAKYYWNRAVEMDPDIPVPNIPELDSFIRDIKSTEDQKAQESQEEVEE